MLSLVSGFALAVLTDRRFVVDSSEHVSKLSDLWHAPGFAWEQEATQLWAAATTELQLIFHSAELNRTAIELGCGAVLNCFKLWLTVLAVGDTMQDEDQAVIAVESDQYFLPLILAHPRLKVLPLHVSTCSVHTFWQERAQQLFGSYSEGSLVGPIMRWLFARPTPAVVLRVNQLAAPLHHRCDLGLQIRSRMFGCDS